MKPRDWCSCSSLRSSSSAPGPRHHPSKLELLFHSLTHSLSLSLSVPPLWTPAARSCLSANILTTPEAPLLTGVLTGVLLHASSASYECAFIIALSLTIAPPTMLPCFPIARSTVGTATLLLVETLGRHRSMACSYHAASGLISHRYNNSATYLSFFPTCLASVIQLSKSIHKPTYVRTLVVLLSFHGFCAWSRQTGKGNPDVRLAPCTTVIPPDICFRPFLCHQSLRPLFMLPVSCFGFLPSLDSLLLRRIYRTHITLLSSCATLDILAPAVLHTCTALYQRASILAWLSSEVGTTAIL